MDKLVRKKYFNDLINLNGSKNMFNFGYFKNISYNDNEFRRLCNYVNQKFRDIGTFLDKEDVNDIELLKESREQGLEKED
jgi:hypothetical protein